MSPDIHPWLFALQSLSEKILALSISSSIIFLEVIMSESYQLLEFPFYNQTFCTYGISGTLFISYSLTSEKDLENVRIRKSDRTKAGKVL